MYSILIADLIRILLNIIGLYYIFHDLVGLNNLSAFFLTILVVIFEVYNYVVHYLKFFRNLCNKCRRI